MKTPNQISKTHFEWIDALKAFALIGILLNHFVEIFGKGPWFTNPSSDWPDFSTRMLSLVETGKGFGFSILQYMGWLGDSGPGVFILVSGLTLTLSALNKGETGFSVSEFYKKRLLRIFPLFIVIHLIILFVYILIPKNQISVSDPTTLLSLFGLRFTDNLFYYLNPSWWFIWLIIQLYVIFPFLFKLLTKFGIRNFLIITIAITFISRGLGLFGIRYNQNLYIWMTGTFFGTRLAEFTVGMVIAAAIRKSNQELLQNFTVKKIGFGALGIYIVGLLCSFTWVGSIASNLVVTIGIAGIFYTIWQALKNFNLNWLNKSILWIGISSYAIFLFHQPFLFWTAHFFHGKHEMILTFIVLIICFPSAYYIERITQYFTKRYETLKVSQIIVWFQYIYCIILILIWYFIEPRIPSGFKYNLFSLFMIISLGIICLLALKFKTIKINRHYPFWFGIIIVSLIQLFLFPANHGFTVIIFAILICFAGFAIYGIVKNIKVATLLFFIISGVLFLIIFLGIEKYLKAKHPLETADRWGEYPALQYDSTRIYSLIPNKETRLKYNNYDYIVKTNSLGMNYPEFNISKSDTNNIRILAIGDAFTMPEGMEYKYSYTALLEKALNSENHKKIEVINAGVTGYGPVEELAQMKELIPLLNPDIVIYEFFINEFEEVSINPQERRSSIGLVSDKNKLNRYFINSQIITYITNFKNLYFDDSKKNTKNWQYWKSFLNYFENTDNPLYKKENLDLLGNYLDSMKQYTDRYQTKFILCFVPASITVSRPSDIYYFPKHINLSNNPEYNLLKPYQFLKQITDSLKINLMDLTPALKSNHIQPVYFPDSWHWNKEGHKVAAKEIEIYLSKNKYLSN